MTVRLEERENVLHGPAEGWMQLTASCASAILDGVERQTHNSSGKVQLSPGWASETSTLLQELSNDPLNILRPASKLQHSLNLASAYCGPPENQENEHRRGRRHDARPHEPKVSTACTLC